MLDEGSFISFKIGWCGNKGFVLNVAVDIYHDAATLVGPGQDCNEVLRDFCMALMQVVWALIILLRVGDL